MSNDKVKKHRRYSLILEDKINNKNILCPFPDIDDISFSDKHDLVSFDAFICYGTRSENKTELMKYLIDLYKQEIYKLSNIRNKNKKISKYLESLSQKLNEILDVSNDFNFCCKYKSMGEYKKMDLIYPNSDTLLTFIKIWHDANLNYNYDGKRVREEVFYHKLLNQYFNQFINEIRNNYEFRSFIMNNWYINKNVKDNISDYFRTDDYQYEHSDSLEVHSNAKYRLLSDLTHYKTLRGIQKQIDYYNDKNKAKIMSDFENEDLMKYITLNYDPNTGLYDKVDTDIYDDNYANLLDEIFSEYDLDDINKLDNDYDIKIDGSRRK